jgi:hypothetical protein
LAYCDHLINLVSIQVYKFILTLRNKLMFVSANIVLENTVERIYVGNQYGEQHRGLFLVRGENVVLLGEVVCKLRSIFSKF